VKLKYEPVAILDFVKALLAVIGTAGVVTIDDALTQAILGVVSAVLFFWTTVSTRKRVTPTAKLPDSYR